MTVKDINASIAFYRDVLRFNLEGIRYKVCDDYLRNIIGFSDCILHIAFLTCPGCRLEIIEYVQPKGKVMDLSTKNIGSSHLCFNVCDIFESYNYLKERGVVFRSEPILINSGPNKGAYAVYLNDPDGFTIELIQLPKNDGPRKC